jgi:Protein of unknown function (DUF998)
MSDTTTMSATARIAPSSSARPMLDAGIIAGPLFLLTCVAQAISRNGFDPARHPISLLALGDLGAIQIANFVVTGVLYLAMAVGAHRTLSAGPGRTWVPRLLAVLGAGLVVAGVFVTDAGAGFPEGAPEGAPQMSWHGVLHELGFAMTVLSWTASCIVLFRRFRAERRRGLAATSLITLVVVLVLGLWPNMETYAPRALAATAIQFGYLSLVARYLRQQ